MQSMRPRERVLAALAGKPIDRPAAVAPTSIATVRLMDESAAPFLQAHRDAALMTRLAETAYTHAGFDTIMPVFSSNNCLFETGGFRLPLLRSIHPEN